MLSLKETVLEYKNWLENMPKLEVMEIYYHDDIVQVQNGEKPITGKKKLLKLEKENLSKAIWQKESIKTIVIDFRKQLVLGEILIEYETQNHEKKKLEKAFVQHWQDDKIKYQRFY